MRIIFEDSPMSHISRLFCGSSAGKHMRFGSGYRGIVAAVREALADGEGAMVYVDVSPSIQSTGEMYSKIRNRFVKYDNVIVIPIICAEYILLRMLVHYGYLNDLRKNDEVLDKFVVGYITELSNGLVNKEVSLEKTCKHLIKNHLPDCMQNSQTWPGRFLCGDCGCDICDIADTAFTDDFKVKAERLYASLPLFFMSGGMEYTKVLDSCGAKYNITSLEDAITNIDKFYTELYDSMGLEKTFIVEL